MKKYLKILLELSLILIAITVGLHLNAFASYLPMPGEDVYISGDIPVPSDTNKSGQEILKDLVIGALGYVKILVVVVAILLITISGYRIAASSGDEEALKKGRNGILYAVIGLVILSMSLELARIFDMEAGTILSSPRQILDRIHLFDRQVEVIVTFIKYILGAFATLMIVISSVKLITSGDNEEEVGKTRKKLLFSVFGLLLVFLGDIFINKVFYVVDKEVYTGMTGVQPQIDLKEGISQIIGITNFIVSFVGPLALIMLIVGAVVYATSGGQEEKMNKAKRLITATVIGIVIIFGAFAAVSTIISGSLDFTGLE